MILVLRIIFLQKNRKAKKNKVKLKAIVTQIQKAIQMILQIVIAVTIVTPILIVSRREEGGKNQSRMQ
jgi:uncharacterized membrane protein